ncbi:hypothetical protein V6N13_016143 [Hibiscus sabdariffa]
MFQMNQVLMSLELINKFKKHMDDMLDVGCLMLATMTSELQKQHEDMVAYEMVQNLKEIFERQKHNHCEDLQENAMSLRDMDFSSQLMETLFLWIKMNLGLINKQCRVQTLRNGLKP